MDKIKMEVPKPTKFTIGTTETSKLRKDINAHVADKENPHNVTAEQLGLENVKSSLEALNDTVEGVRKDVSSFANVLLNHDSNENIHVQAIDKDNWNDKYTKDETDTKLEAIQNHVNQNTDNINNSIFPDLGALKTSLGQHTVDSDIHITPDERAKWNDADNKFALIKNGIIDVFVTPLRYNGISVFNKEGGTAKTIEEAHTGVFKGSGAFANGNTGGSNETTGSHKASVLIFQTHYKKETVISHELVKECVYQTMLSDDGIIRTRTITADDFPVSNMEWETISTTKTVKDYVDANCEINTINETAEGSTITLTDSANAKLKGLKIYGKTTQADVPSIENPQPLVSVGDGGIVGVSVYGKNLLPYPYVNTTITKNGVTFTDNGDGSVTANGTATIDTYFELANDKYRLKLPTGNYMLSGCPMGGAEKTYIVYTVDASDNARVATEYGNGRLFSADSSKEYKAYIKIGSGTTVNNLTFKPQIEAGTVATEYEPYKEVQTVAFSTPNGLPGVPVTSGGNYTDENGQQYVCDEIDGARRKYAQRIGIYTTDNTIKATRGKIADGGEYQCFYLYNAVPSNNNTLYNNSNALCNKLIHQNVYNKDFEGFYISDAQKDGKTDDVTVSVKIERLLPYGYIANDTTTHIKVFDAWLVDNPLTFAYIMAEPIERDLTEEEIAQYKALTTHKSVTNVFNDADAHMKVDYVADPKTYIDNKFAELTALILEG